MVPTPGMEAHVDVHALRTFVEVARQQGFTRASETLHVTQPAISKAVKVLEEEVVEVAALRRGRLRLGMPPIVGVTFFPPVLAEFHQAYPGVLLELREEGSHHIESLVMERELDVGAVVLPTDEKAFGTLPFVRDELRAVLHADHPLARRPQVALRDLAGTPFVLYRPEFALHGHILEACRRAGFRPTVVSESSHWDFIVAMVAANIGLALLPSTICRQLDPRQVRSVPMTAPLIPWNVALIWRKDRQLPPATRAWLELAQRRLVEPGKAAGGRSPRPRPPPTSRPRTGCSGRGS